MTNHPPKMARFPAPPRIPQPIADYRPNDLGNYRGKRTPRKVDATPLAPAQQRAGVLAAPSPRSRHAQLMAALPMLAILGMRAR